ncbi:MAG: hypothetical protein H7203_06835 [Rhizobacter sp.]|nr:hypothetical protein [Burkholderiales bacterium]
MRLGPLTARLPTLFAIPDRYFAFGALLAGLLTLGCFVPLLDGWWFRDDFWMLTLSRNVEQPLAFWTSDHSASFFYRPLGMTLWWVTTKLFGTDPMPHYVINAVLHWSVAVAFAAWMRGLSGNVWAGVAAMLLYAVHPVALRTSQWLSDRFDLLATGMVFAACALLVSASGSRWRRAGLCLLVAGACTSKETGFLVLPLAVVHWLTEAEATNRARAKADVLSVAVVVVGVMVWRTVVTSTEGATPMFASLLALLPQGVWAYLNALPRALTGQFDAHALLGQIAPWLALAVVALLCVQAFLEKGHRGLSGRTLPIAVTLLVSAALLHAPIAAQNLFGNALQHDAISARLFHLTLAGGFLLLLVPCLRIARIIHINRGWWVAMAVGLTTAMLLQSLGVVRAWSALTNGELRPLLKGVVNQIDQKALPNPCRIVVRGPLAGLPDFQQLSDVMVKALARAPSRPLLHCIVVAADAVPTFAIVASDLCSRDAVRPFAQTHPVIPPRPFANLCYQFLLAPGVVDKQTPQYDIEVTPFPP